MKGNRTALAVTMFLVLAGSLQAQNGTERRAGTTTGSSNGSTTGTVAGTTGTATAIPDSTRRLDSKGSTLQVKSLPTEGTNATTTEGAAILLSADALSLPTEDFKADLKRDTLFLVPQRELRFDPLFPMQYPVVIPFIRNYSNSGYLGTWEGFTFTAQGTFSEHPFLLTSRSASFGVARHSGPLYYNLNASMTNYVAMPSGSQNQFGFSGIIRYQMSDIASLTAFSQVYNVNPGFNMAAYPFVNTSRYGGYVTLQGDNVGVDLGVQRYYDPMRGGWQTAPIVTPTVKLWDSVTIGVPLGGMIQNAADRMHQKNTPPPPPPAAKRR